MSRAPVQGVIRLLVVVTLLAAPAVDASSARGSSGPSWNAEARARPVTSVFFVAKSANRNQVHYGVHVDSHCRIAPRDPVYAYWRDFEVGPRATSALLGIEQSAYGVTPPRGIENGASGGRVSFHLRAFSQRMITIQSFTSAGTCKAWAMTNIGKQPALLSSVYVELGFLISVNYLLLDGFRLSDGTRTREKVD